MKKEMLLEPGKSYIKPFFGSLLTIIVVEKELNVSENIISNYRIY